MKYLNKFNRHAQYESLMNGKHRVVPSINYCADYAELHFNKNDYSTRYLRTTALEDGTISFNIWFSMDVDMIESISYSTDSGVTWTTTPNQNNKQENLQITINVETGDSVLWKGSGTQTGVFSEADGDSVGSFFSSTADYNVDGNVMSLIYGDNFVGHKTLEANSQFARLFNDYGENLECHVVNAEKLLLPATDLAESCYESMFSDCTSLVNAPDLPATTLVKHCYRSMFYGCTSLTRTPELPATTLADGCYQYMFQDCASLTKAPELTVTALANYCYNYMFAGCTSLAKAPALPATVLEGNCYGYMFQGCTSLTKAPALPATTLGNNCYQYMFQGCTSLTKAPDLPATTVPSRSYYAMFNGCSGMTTPPVMSATVMSTASCQNMFMGCKSLTKAPELLATTLSQSCYNGMFSGCTSLNYIKAMFTTTPSTTYTNKWVTGVASTGTFYKNTAATWSVTGDSGVPTGWTIKTVSS